MDCSKSALFSSENNEESAEIDPCCDISAGCGDSGDGFRMLFRIAGCFPDRIETPYMH